jgi:hypothetical protein
MTKVAIVSKQTAEKIIRSKGKRIKMSIYDFYTSNTKLLWLCMSLGIFRIMTSSKLQWAGHLTSIKEQ